MKIAITGANSSVGVNLLGHLSKQPQIEAVAGIRSESAIPSLPDLPQIKPRIISYENIDDLTSAFENVDCVIHLAGILIETKSTSYESANVAATAAVVEASRKAQVKKIIFISVVGAGRNSTNRYFKSKSDAETLVSESGIPAIIIRTPILLGPGTAGASSVIWAASQKRTKLLGDGNYSMRPLDVDDLSQAILNSCANQETAVSTYELAGPEPILYSELIKKVAQLMDNEVTIASVPIWLAKIGAAISSSIKGGMSPTVIDVITKDEIVENNADHELGITLTPLTKTLEKILNEKNT